jgi:DNA-binding winged helix-turn-helix (wHTH) protein
MINAITRDNHHLSIIIDTLRDLTFLDSRFLSSIKAIRDRFKGKVNFIFVSERPIIEDRHYIEYKKFADFACHVEYISTPLTEEDSNVVKKIYTKYNPNNSIKPKDIKKILSISGGIVGLITSMMRHIADSPNKELKPKLFLANTNIRQRIKFILNQFDAKELKLLQNLAGNSSRNTDLSIFLKESGILDTRNKQINSSLIRSYINSKYFKHLLEQEKESLSNETAQEGEDRKNDEENKDPDSKHNDKQKGLYIDLKTGEIFKNGKRMEDCLSPTEIKIYKYLSENPQELISRDEIAKQMWGNAYLEKYSDWAIDKAISRLRKKVEDDEEKNQYIITIKGKGIKFYP